MYNPPSFRASILKAFWAEQRQLVKKYSLLFRRDAARMQAERSWTIQVMDDFGRWSEVDAHEVASVLETAGIFCHTWWTYHDSERLTFEEAVALLAKVRDVLAGRERRGPRYKWDGKNLRVFCLLDGSFVPMDIL